MSLILAIIPARGGSKSVPRKNILLLHGQPLLAYSICAAQSCVHISDCVVSTEDVEIRRVARDYGAVVVDRPSELATDAALSADVVEHVLLMMKEQGTFPDYFVLLQPTSPLRNGVHLTQCVEQFLAGDYSSAVSVTDCEHHPYKTFIDTGKGKEVLREFRDLETPRQLLPRAFRLNGAIFVAKSSLFLEKKSFFINPLMIFQMDQESSIDIDSELDLLVAERILETQKTYTKK